MSDNNNVIVEHARNRAISYRKCGQSGEHTADVLDELAFQVERLSAELAAMQKQRDEARRDACAFEAINRWNIAHPKGIILECAVVRISREIAVERGWDCFKEGGGA